VFDARLDPFDPQVRFAVCQQGPDSITVGNLCGERDHFAILGSA
jgi:hypothetical protein